MKKTGYFLVVLVFLLMLPSALSYGGNNGFGANFSIIAADYIVYDRFERGDSGTIGNAETGQTWVKSSGVASIKDNLLQVGPSTGQHSVRLPQDFTASYTPLYTCDWIVRKQGPNVNAAMFQRYRRASGVSEAFYSGCDRGFGQDTWLFYDTDSADWDTYTPSKDCYAATDTTYLVRITVDTIAEFFNSTLFNFEVDGSGVITLTQFGIVVNEASQWAADVDTIEAGANFPATGEFNVTELACYNGTTRPPAPEPPADSFTITVKDFDNSSSLGNFTVIISNETETYTNQSTTGDINFENITAGLYNIRITSAEDGGYYSEVHLNYDVSVDIDSRLVKFFRVLNISYGGFVEFNQSNFTRNLTYDIAYRCPVISNTSIDTYINGSIVKQSDVTCNNQTRMFNESIKYSTEGNFSIWNFLNTTYQPETNHELFGNTSFIFDLLNPVIALLNFTVPNGFGQPRTNVSLTCTDTIFKGNLTYNSTFNDIQLFYGNHSNNTEQKNETVLLDDANSVLGTCSDPFGSTTDRINRTVFSATLFLIDEVDNTDFNLNNVTSARAYLDQNQSFFDFKVTNTTQVNFTSYLTNRLRIELIYLGGVTITRYIDTELLGNDIRICANKEGVTHFQQIILSASIRQVILRNLFANCDVAADSTRFAFQDSLILQAFTINSQYTLINRREGREIVLASVDGSLESFINLDTLELGQTPFNLNIQGEAVSFEKTGPSQIKIHYVNLQEDNSALTLSITNLDTNVLEFSSSSFADPNEVTVFFEYGYINNVTNTTLFQLQVDSISPRGENSFKRYFNTNAKSGIISGEFAFLMSVLLVVFGLTFATTRNTLSWFGVFILIAAIATLTFAIATTMVILLMAMEVILLVYIVVMISISSYSTLT